MKGEKSPLVTEGCWAICNSLPSPKPLGLLPSAGFRDVDFENIDLYVSLCHLVNMLLFVALLPIALFN